MNITSLDRFNDLQKQGFMKPIKRRKVTMFEAWLPNGEGCCYKGASEIEANRLVAKYGGKVKRVRK